MERKNYGDLLKLARAEVVREGKGIFGVVNPFLLVMRIVDTVLLVNFREERKEKRKREEKVKVSAVLKA